MNIYIFPVRELFPKLHCSVLLVYSIYIHVIVYYNMLYYIYAYICEFARGYVFAMFSPFFTMTCEDPRFASMCRCWRRPIRTSMGHGPRDGGGYFGPGIRSG